MKYFEAAFNDIILGEFCLQACTYTIVHKKLINIFANLHVHFVRAILRNYYSDDQTVYYHDSE